MIAHTVQDPAAAAPQQLDAAVDLRRGGVRVGETEDGTRVVVGLEQVRDGSGRADADEVG
jgi:hypothetical protein